MQSVKLPIYSGGWEFWSGDQYFLLEMGVGGLPLEGGNQCLLLIVHGFCSIINALYSASLSLRMLIFLLNPFDTYDCFYFGSNLLPWWCL